MKQNFQVVLPLFLICFFISSICYGTITLNQPKTSSLLNPKRLKISSSRPITQNLVKNSGSSNSLDGWSARKGITLKPSENDGVQISGTQQSGWNYAVISLSDPYIEPGAIYRLEAWMNVGDISDAAYPPYLKLGISDKDGKWITNYNTSKYDLINKGTWQKLWAEFTVDSKAYTDTVAVQKGTKNSISAILSVKDIALTKIDAFSPVLREELDDDINIENIDLLQKDNHPRLYLDKEKIELIKSNLNKYPYSKFWEKIKRKADDYINKVPPQDVDSYDDNTIRKFGNCLPYIGISYLLTEDDKYLNGAKKWMDALCSYPDWASNKDLGAAHLLFGMSVVYDWIYDKLSTNEKNSYETKIAKHAELFYNIVIKEDQWWAKSYLQNHNYTNIMSMAVAGIALYDKDSRAESWLAAAENNFDTVLNLLSPDGASHEGVSYWSYGTEALLKYFMAVKPIYGIQKVLNNQFFQNTARFRLYASLPGYEENVDYADSPRFDWYGPGYILRVLADIFNDGHAQWLAEKIEQARGEKARISWLDFLWYHEDVKPVTPDLLPKSKLFENLGIFISRSDWSDNAFWTFFKAGPPQGHIAEEKGCYAGSHIHPDEGNFLLWADKKWLMVDDGYVYKKRTENHNVVTINNIGQSGEGKTWFDSGNVRKNKSSAKIIYSEIKPDYQYIVASLGNIYKPEAGLKIWYRTFVILHRQALVIIKDDFELETKGEIKTFFHFNENLKFNSVNNNKFYFSMDNLNIAVNILTSGLTWNEKLSVISSDEQKTSKTYGNYSTKLITFGNNTLKDTNLFIVLKQKLENNFNDIQFDWNKNENTLNIKSLQYGLFIDFNDHEVVIITK